MTADDRVAERAGELVFADPRNNASLSRRSKTGRAMRLARGVYAVEATASPAEVAHVHRFAIIEHFWRGAVLCGTTAVHGGEVLDGRLFIAHPDPGRAEKIELPGLTIYPQTGPGPLPGDEPAPNGLWVSGPARRLVENVNLRGRPARSQAGRHAVQEQIEQLRRQGAGAIQAILDGLEPIGEYFEAGAIEFVRAGLVAALNASDAPRQESPVGSDAERENADGSSGASPYSTGGGGVTFERRVAAVYLAHLLTGTPAAECGETRRVTRVAFQQAPDYGADDLVISAENPDDPNDAATLSMAVRRAPRLSYTDTDKKNKQLIIQLVRDSLRSAPDSPTRTVALTVAGTQSAARDLHLLAHHALAQSDPDRFVALIEAPRKFKDSVKTRLGHVTKLVAHALGVLGLPDDDAAARRATFELLAQLAVLQPRLESPDEADWAALMGQLMPAARGNSPAAAVRLRDRLEVLAARYAPAAADIDERRLRRDVHDVLEATFHRNERAWLLLRQLDTDWRRDTRLEIGSREQSGGTLHIERAAERDAIQAAIAASSGAVVVHGQSGVGKSALIAEAIGVDPDQVQAFGLDLRDLPTSAAELTHQLGVPLEQALAEMSGPRRVLVVDRADAILEQWTSTLAHVLAAARTAGITVVVVVATDALGAVRVVVEQAVGGFVEHEIHGLDDEDLDRLAAAFPHMRGLLENPQALELMRRPAVADLLVRAAPTGVPVSDADAMREVWRGLVRRNERADHGRPQARATVLWQLARHQLDQAPAETVLESLDAEAVDGLRRDGLLRPFSSHGWQQLPVFAHDLLRTYALAQLLLLDERPGHRLAAAPREPRWALPAARLACQAVLSGLDSGSAPTLGRRFVALQHEFDQLVTAGFGARWADVPSEALLTAGHDGPTLSGSWPAITAVPGMLTRMLRLLDQRHRRDGILTRLVSEPVIACMLDHGTRGTDTKAVDKAIRGWELALIVAGVPAGDPLRMRLGEQLVARCRHAAEELAERQRLHEARLAARTPDEVAADDKQARKFARLSGPAPRGRRRVSRERRELPRVLTDEAMLEQLALLGCDLGEDGERLLREVAEHAPQRLAPALEEIGTGRALAEWSPDLLGSLVTAYYIDEPLDEAGWIGTIHDDGIRRHRWRGPISPMSAHYRGPFSILLRANFRSGVAIINTILNVGARARITHFTAPRFDGSPTASVEDYTASFVIDGTERHFIGDDQVWAWYRGATVGPYPCMSALQALELVCDELIAAGIQPALLVPVLLNGCENLAMVGLVVGLLVRHAESAGTALDDFLAEPDVWEYEFSRVVHEHSGLAVASAPAIAHPDRRRWTPRDTVMWFVLNADANRKEHLRRVGQRLEQRALQLTQRERQLIEGTEAVASFDDEENTVLAAVRGWASTFDWQRYEFGRRSDGSVEVGVNPPEDVRAVLQPTNDDLARRGREQGLINRYGYRGKRTPLGAVPVDELSLDIAAARELVGNPLGDGRGRSADAPAAVASYVLRAAFDAGQLVPAADVQWAATLLLDVVEQGHQDQWGSDVTIYSWGADRSAARALPLLLLPQAADVRAALGLADRNGMQRLGHALHKLGVDSSFETKLFFATALDPVWRSPCADGTCHHHVAFRIVEDSARACTFVWSQRNQRFEPPPIEGRLADKLATIAGDKIIVQALTAAIRAAAPASVNGCCAEAASELLDALLEAHQRGRKVHDTLDQFSRNDALVAARALLTTASTGADVKVYHHVTGYADHSQALMELLDGLHAAAEENPTVGATAHRLWPGIMNRVLDLIDEGHDLRDDRSFGDYALGACIPAAPPDNAYFYREIDGEPYRWGTVLDYVSDVNRWLPYAAGIPECVDAVISGLDRVPMAEQVRIGLSWVEALVIGGAEQIARRSFLLPQWLRRIRRNTDADTVLSWQRIVDALAVAGDSRIADLVD